jgi:hypothetical protein
MRGKTIPRFCRSKREERIDRPIKLLHEDGDGFECSNYLKIRSWNNEM